MQIAKKEKIEPLKQRMRKRFAERRPLSEEEKDRFLRELSKYKWYANAVLGIRFLQKRKNERQYDTVPTSVLMKVTGATRVQWPAICDLMRQICFCYNCDIVNVWGEGYTFARYPEQSLREVVKSFLRGISHFKRGEFRLDVFDEDFEKMGKTGLKAWGIVQGVLTTVAGAVEGGRGPLLEVSSQLKEFDGIEDDVSDITEKLLNLGESKKVVLGRILDEIVEDAESKLKKQ